ncbi:DUF4179 domain-containing protein [Paenibacillus sp. DCT19]|uniref:DUF4179 domain-containing protein n=1 Tax=Paenibacillus sp. DCT19 TaxID=2211212 RepID=UPI000FE1B030|nr:DUF4179 domain-containing protein [Paenibacillus sp. DCT19]
MNQYIKKDNDTPQPDYDVMWSAIEKEVHQRKAKTQSSRRGMLHRIKAIPVGIAFSCFLLVAIPVFASVTIDWDRIGGRNVANALQNGIGQQYDLQSSNAGVTMNLNGVVTDGEKMKVLISLSTATDLTQYTGFATEINTLNGPDGTAKVYGYLGYDPDSQKLLGVYETPDALKDDAKKYTFEAQNLILYRDKDIPLASNHETEGTIVTGVAQYPTIHMQSVRHVGDQTVVRYKVTASPTDLGRGNPHIVMHNQDDEWNAIPTILPNEGSDLLIEQVFNMSETEWKNANLHFTFIEEAKRIEGTWKFDFKADGKKASEAMYSKSLITSTEFQERTGVSIDQLAITPLDIQVRINKEDSLTKGIVHYNTTELIIGAQKITGGRYLKGDQVEGYQHYFQFESPVWYKDWSGVPMKMILQDAVVEKRDTTRNWVALHRPTTEKQHTKLQVDGLEIQFAYYMDGQSLMVESSSTSPDFRGVNQTTLRINGKEMVPEITPKGMVSTGVNIDTYRDIPTGATLELNPGIYKYTDPSRNVEIKL